MGHFWISVFPTIGGFAAAIIADRKDRNGTAWGLASFILPILALVVVFMSRVPDDAGGGRRGAVRKWIGVPAGLLALLAGAGLATAGDPHQHRHWLTAVGLGCFLLWRSFRGGAGADTGA